MTTRLLARFHRDTLAAQHARDVDLATDTADETPTGADRENPTMGNEQHARGVPILARGICGAMNGTRPGDELRDFDNGHRRGEQSNLGRIP
jgi:hypothetical protein